MFDRLRLYIDSIRNCQVTYLLVDNKHETLEPSYVSDSVIKMGGDNTSREFSGWQKGIKAINTLNIKTDVILLVNNAFLLPGESFLKDYANYSLLKRVAFKKSVIGRIDTHGQQTFVYGYDVSEWVCTNCLFAPKRAFDDIGSVVTINKHNIYDFLEKEYPRKHLMHDQNLLGSELKSGLFNLTMEYSFTGLDELRIILDKYHIPRNTSLNDKRHLGFILDNIKINNKNIYNFERYRGYYDDKWIDKIAVLGFNIAESGTFKISGYIPPEIFNDIYHGNLRIRIYNDSYLFKKDAPISNNHKRIIIKWLTEEWHSRFEINSETWSVFQAKLSTILNEALLSARFKKYGYDLNSYGVKKYY
ncbi:MAG: hypothetical protein ACMUJM_10215 [bacterium]